MVTEAVIVLTKHAFVIQVCNLLCTCDAPYTCDVPFCMPRVGQRHQSFRVIEKVKRRSRKIMFNLYEN